MFTKIKQQLIEGKSLLQFSFLKATGQGLAMVVPLVVAKFFSPELFGSYSLAKMIVFFFSTLLIASAQTPFVVFANQEKIRSGKINKSFSVQCVFLILSFCIFVVITLPLSKYIIAFAKINRGDLFFVLLAFIGLALKIFLCNLFMAMGQRIKNSLAELVFGFLSVIFIFVFYFLDMINLRTVFLVYLLSAIILVIIFFRAIDFKLLFPFNLEKEHFRGMFDFTKWVFLGVTAVYFINWGDNLVLRYFVSMEDIGIYNLGYQFFKGIITLTAISSSYFLPFVSQNIDKPQKMRNFLYNKRPKILLAGTIAIVLFFFLVPYVLNIFYDESYRYSTTIFRVLIIAAAMTLYNTFYHAIISSMKKYKVIQIVNVFQISLNLILDLILVPIMGILGAAIATVIAYFCRVVTIDIYFRLKLRKALNILD